MRLDTERLAYLVKQKRGHLSLRDVESQIGVSISTLSRVERDNGQDILMTNFLKLCEWVGVAPGSLFAGGDKHTKATDISVNGFTVRINVDVIPLDNPTTP